MSDLQAVEWTHRDHGAAPAEEMSALQLHQARCRYRSRVIYPGAIDLTVVPRDPTLADGKPVEPLTLGDSGMAGVGVTQAAVALPALIAPRAAASTGRPVNVLSHAQTGARTHGVLIKRLPMDLRKPDVVVLRIDKHDVANLSRTRRLADDTACLLARLHRLGAPVVMSSLPEFAAMRAVPSILRVALHTRGALVRKMHGRTVLDAGSTVNLADVAGPLDRQILTESALMSPGRFHPSRAGCSRIADVLAPAISAAVTQDGDSRVISNLSWLTLEAAA